MMSQLFMSLLCRVGVTLTQSPWASASTELQRVQNTTTSDIQSYNSSLGY